jgi:pimeloyl-ACP methyl ester carboxylesterase
MVATQPPVPRAAEPSRPPWPVFPFQLCFADLGGKLIHYIEGLGSALRLMSAGQWSSMVQDVILPIRGRFGCLVLDFPGCGLSPVPCKWANRSRSVRIQDIQNWTIRMRSPGL